MSACFAEEIALPQGISAYRFGNELVSMTILPEKGADIHEWVHRRTGTDVLWKSPWGLRRHRNNTTSSVSTMVAWMDAYQGGWQVLFPSGGGPSQYRGVELNFHGEASAVAWDLEEFGASTDGAGLRCSTRLARSPFHISRSIHLAPGASHIVIDETITNDGGEAVDYMWGHHPAYGAPFIGADTVIDTNAATVSVDEGLTGATSLLEAGATFPWPGATQHGNEVDLRTIPAEGAGMANMAYIHDFPGDVGWYGFTNRKLGFGAGLSWRTDDFPCAWFWQELNGTSGYPWWKGEYVLAIEPNTSFPGHGLAAVKTRGMSRSLEPGESATARMTAVMYESTTGVSSIDLDGNVTVRQERS
ncbi:MAG: DUF4432 family protein [Thermomicrobiales bacterium]|nr:DUF4432 family protein [Thermomicrobiales bacterium]